MPSLTRSLPCVLLVAALAAACAPSQQQAAAPAAAQAPSGTQGNAAAQTETEASTAVASAGDEVICKKYDVTGSRIAKRKVCMTKREWEVYRQRTQDEYQRAADRRGSSQPGGESLGAR